MKPKSVNFTINLLPRDPFFDSLLGRTLKWALSVGRYLVIFTELVVIISFATRFTLDRQVTDLNDALNQKKLVIESYGELESTFRTIQTKLTDSKQIDQQINIADAFPKLTAIVPREVQLDELTVTADSVFLSGSAPSQNTLNLFLNNIQVSKDFFSVNVDKIESRGDKIPGYLFTVRASTQQEVQAKANQATTTAPKPSAAAGARKPSTDTEIE
jgi:Tfp pilus assembly protein PilN